MTTPTDVCNIALAEIGNRVAINSIPDGSPAGNAAAILYTPKLQALLRTAHWDFACARSVPLTQWKAVVINGSLSNNPPPQPWQFSYLYPSDCIKMRFIQPMITVSSSVQVVATGPGLTYPYPQVPTAAPFVPSTDFDLQGNPIRVILSNVPQALATYTRDLSQTPDTWDPLFMAAATAFLAAYFVPALSLDKGQMQIQIGQTKSVIDQARAANGNESIGNVDHTPDWIRARRATGLPWMWNTAPSAGAGGYGGWDSLGLPDGQFY